jgi:hypothetical protein
MTRTQVKHLMGVIKEEVTSSSPKLLCKILGHNMYQVYIMTTQHADWGKHKCSRPGCDHEHDWQYDKVKMN